MGKRCSPRTMRGHTQGGPGVPCCTIRSAQTLTLSPRKRGAAGGTGAARGSSRIPPTHPSNASLAQPTSHGVRGARGPSRQPRTPLRSRSSLTAQSQLVGCLLTTADVSAITHGLRRKATMTSLLVSATTGAFCGFATCSATTQPRPQSAMSTERDTRITRPMRSYLSSTFLKGD